MSSPTVNAETTAEATEPGLPKFVPICSDVCEKQIAFPLSVYKCLYFPLVLLHKFAFTTKVGGGGRSPPPLATLLLSIGIQAYLALAITPAPGEVGFPGWDVYFKSAGGGGKNQ